MGCGHSQQTKECSPPVECPAQCLQKEKVKKYHLEKFQKLCIALHYGQHLITNSIVKRNIREALAACNWIYEEEAKRNVAQPG